LGKEARISSSAKSSRCCISRSSKRCTSSHIMLRSWNTLKIWWGLRVKKESEKVRLRKWIDQHKLESKMCVFWPQREKIKNEKRIIGQRTISKLFTKKTRRSFVFTSRPDRRSNKAVDCKKQNKRKGQSLGDRRTKITLLACRDMARMWWYWYWHLTCYILFTYQSSQCAWYWRRAPSWSHRHRPHPSHCLLAR